MVLGSFPVWTSYVVVVVVEEEGNTQQKNGGGYSVLFSKSGIWCFAHTLN